MFSCEKCNKQYKKNHFPLENESTRTQNHLEFNPLANEKCLLINPSEEQPDKFIAFREEVPVPVNSSLKGEEAIKIYGLERMNNTRLEHLKTLTMLLPFAKLDENDAKLIKKLSKLLPISPRI